MNLNKSFVPKKKEKYSPQWHVIDAAGKIVGRLATEIASALRGKNNPIYTPHAESNQYIVVINASKVIFTGKKMRQKTYHKHTGYIGNDKQIKVRDLMQTRPEEIIKRSVKGMLPKNRICRKFFSKQFKVYAGGSHKHQAQIVNK